MYNLHSLSSGINFGTSWHLMMVRVDIYEWYELTWVRVNICCVIRDVDSYHYLTPALLGTSWHHLWYELTSLVVRVNIYWWYELTWVRVDMGTSWHGASWHGYELTVTRPSLPYQLIPSHRPSVNTNSSPTHDYIVGYLIWFKVRNTGSDYPMNTLLLV